jgi:hypothetical protein
MLPVVDGDGHGHGDGDGDGGGDGGDDDNDGHVDDKTIKDNDGDEDDDDDAHNDNNNDGNSYDDDDDDDDDGDDDVGTIRIGSVVAPIILMNSYPNLKSTPLYLVVVVEVVVIKHAVTQFLVLCYWGRAGLDGHTPNNFRK